jgi:sugar (pentulose or hexulose) kinase
MKKKYLVGVDGGTQSSKVEIFDLQGNVVCQGKEPLKPLHMPKPGVVEHPDDDLWDSIVIASRKALENFDGNPQDIIGIGLCTIRCCRASLKEDGTLFAPVLSWMDLRLSKPYEFEDPSVCYVTTSSGYISHRFTGEFKDTASNYEGPWPIDKNRWQWSDDPQILEKYRLPKDILFDLIEPGSILGYVTAQAAKATGFPVGIPVVATANDKAVEALGSGLPFGNTALVSLGTYICSMVYGQKNVINGNHFFTNMASIPGRYLYESGGIRRGMWTVSWFKDLLGEELINNSKTQGISPEECINAEAMSVPVGSDGLMTVMDWLAPTDKPYKKGLMIGFDGRHTRAHMYRSILEAIALTMKNHADAMCNELDISMENIIVSGGGSNSDLFMQIFTDVFGVPAVRNQVNGSASLGAAICAAVAVGAYPGFDEAIAAMVKIRDRFQPIPEHTSIYKQMNEKVYKHITGYSDEILKKSYPIFG